MSNWGEIRCDYLDPEGFWTVDAWKTADDDEEGRVIAHIDDLTGRIVYNDPLARVDSYAQEVIAGKVREIRSKKIRVLYGGKYHLPVLQVKTDRGILQADPDDEDLDRIYLSVIYPDNPTDLQNFDLVRVDMDKAGIAVKAWDIGTDSEVYDRFIPDEEISEIFKDLAG